MEVARDHHNSDNTYMPLNNKEDMEKFGKDLEKGMQLQANALLLESNKSNSNNSLSGFFSCLFMYLIFKWLGSGQDAGFIVLKQTTASLGSYYLYMAIASLALFILAKAVNHIYVVYAFIGGNIALILTGFVVVVLYISPVSSDLDLLEPCGGLRTFSWVWLIFAYIGAFGAAIGGCCLGCCFCLGCSAANSFKSQMTTQMNTQRA
jgi:hypothetical protein